MNTTDEDKIAELQKRYKELKNEYRKTLFKETNDKII